MTTASETRSVFVYGTLRPGQGNYGWVAEDHRPVDRPALLDGFRLIGLGRPFPYAVPADDETIVGDLLTFPEETWDAALADLDSLEGVGHGLYERILVAVRTNEGPMIAWVYTPTNPARREATHAPIPGNDWLAHQGASR